MAINRRKNQCGFSYQVKVKDAFGTWFTKTFRRKIDAEQFEREILQRKGAGGSFQTKECRELTVSQYWDQWASECRRVSDGWKISQNQMAKDYILPLLGDLKLISVRPVEVAQVLNYAKDLGRAPRTILQVYNLLHKLFGDACEHYEIVDRNPVHRTLRPRISREARNFLTPAESRRLLAICRGHQVGPAIWLQIYAGLRPSEVQALKVGAIDLVKGQILIKEAFNKKTRRIQPYPKQLDWGTAPVPLPLRQFFIEHLRGRPTDTFVVEGVRGEMMSQEAYGRQLKALCKAAGVTVVTPHELRHSSTELYIEQGASVEDIRRLLNHKSLSSTACYLHRTDERLTALAEKVGSEKIEFNPTPRLKAVN